MKKNSIINALLIAFIFGFAAKSSGQTYCNSNFTNVNYEYVKNVTYAGINNTTAGTAGGPVNYLSLGPANVTVGTANNLSVTIQVDGSEYVFAFIDWNHNGTLNDAGEVYTLASNVSTPGPFTVSVTPPPAAYIGTTRMRVMLAFANATPTPCLNSTYGEAEDYTVNVQAAINCSAVTFPSSATVNASPASICVSGNVTMTMTTPTAMPSASGITYKWQSSSAAGGPFVDVPGAVTTVPTYTTTTPITTTTYYRCIVLCNATTTVLTSAASAAVIVNNPGTPTVTGATRCGPGSLTLSATPPAGSSIGWYTTATGGIPIATGNTYTTPVIPTTTTYYAAASMGGFGSAQTLSTTSIGGNGCSGGAMFDIDPNVTINIDSFKALAAGTASSTITIYKKAGTYLGSETNPSAWTTVATLTVNTTAGQMVNLALPTPLVISANVLTGIYIEYNATYSNIAAGTLYSNADLDIVSGAGLCSSFGGVNAGRAFNGSVHYRTSGCEGARQAVVATITPGPAISIARPPVVCAGEIANFVVSSTPMTNYTNYTWTPNIADLYTNALTTTPYMSGSAPNVYFKSNDNGAHTYYLFSSGATPAACTHADTFSVWVQPDSVSIKGSPDSICVSGATTLSLLPATGYAPNSVQWQESVTGSGSDYTNINGATNPSYTTVTLSANRYYRALVKSTNDTCEMPVKYVVVVNPQLIGVTDSFNCGPGTVTLKAQTGGNSTAKWYENPTGGVAIGSNSPWTTPSLAASQTYYVSAEGGAGGGAPVTVTVGTGTAANADYEYPTPFGNYYGAGHEQYLVLASDLLSQGASPGNITSVAFNLSSAYSSAALKSFEIKMGNTNVTSLNTTLISTPMTVVRPAANYTPPAAAGYTTINFSTPFNWTGGNIIVDVSFTNCTTCNNTSTCSTTWSANGTVRQTATSYNSAHSVYYDGNCSISSMTPGGFYYNDLYTKRPNMRFGATAPCQTPRVPVHANIYPTPVVDLGPDVNMCVDAGAAIVLDAGVQPNTPSFLWDDLTTSQVRAVNTSGTYNVKVTNGYTCVGSDTVNIILRRNPVIDLGDDTTVCNGVTLTLDPGAGGIEYFWSTGQPNQTIDVNAAGSYAVFVTNSEGCVAMDTIQVMMQGELPTIQGIQVSNDGDSTFHFTAVSPMNVIGYDWDFGDGTLHSYEEAPHHTYATSGDYIVVLHLSSTCGFANDTVSAHIVGIHQITVNKDELTVYPNPSNGQATILNKGALKMEKIEVYNILGQVVYHSKADAKDKHVINLDKIASGIYTIEIYTDKGTVARKLEIIK